jgi:TPP-dependent indolepyruvate ferredoxin oxidoreductase alpha subunit
MNEQDIKIKKALLLLEATENKALLGVVENDYHAMTQEIEGLVRLMKERRRDISIETYESMFSDGSFRKMLEDYARVCDESDRLAALTEAF